VKTPELLAPGGSFQAAYQAFEAGADGVYLGLKEFSARKAAQNFSLDQLRRIRQLASSRGRRIYVTLNTVVRDRERSRLMETLAWLESMTVDGVIVQDLGVVELISRRFPRIPVHASTQMAVHNDAGLGMAEEMGIRRVILSREIPLEGMRRLRERHPGIELEVFIHGALCYSFSGACLASWALTGRSGNRGDCAQICRSLFRSEDADCGEGHFFSCRDLFLGREVRKLAEIGIDALKIEGRMKAPEYVHNVTRLYRAVLDRGDALPDAEYEELVRRAETAFVRRPTTGWLHASAGSHLVDPLSPGHRGALLGTIASTRGKDMYLTIGADISLRDGVGFVPEGGGETVVFSVRRIIRAGREVAFARAGEAVGIEVPADAGAPVPKPGTEIRHMSSRFLDLPQPKEAGFPLYRIPVAMKATLDSKSVLTVAAGGFPLFCVPLSVEKAEQRKSFAGILAAMFRQSGDSALTMGELEFVNRTGLADDELFVPPSLLKKAKNDFYRFLQSAFEAQVRADPADIDWPKMPESPLGRADLEVLAHRGRLSPAGGAVPFVSPDPDDVRLEDLFSHAGFSWLPLPPVVMDDRPWVSALERLSAADPLRRLAVGLNNVGHLGLAAALAARGNIWFFADFFLYVANRGALSFLLRRVPRLLFAYRWIEEDPAEEGEGPLVRIAGDFRAPLFTGLGCFARHSLHGGSCPGDCPKDYQRTLHQGRTDFQVIVRDCVTYLFKAP
jgi:U32 family peptidase